MTATKPLSLSQRVSNYQKQMDPKKPRALTNKQKKRSEKKYARADKRGQKELLS